MHQFASIRGDMKMQTHFVNTGIEPIQFLVFVVAVGLILAFVRRLP